MSSIIVFTIEYSVQGNDENIFIAAYHSVISALWKDGWPYWLYHGAFRLDPQAEFFYIYGWLVKIYGCFSAKPENCGEGIFRLKTSAVYQIYG